MSKRVKHGILWVVLAQIAAIIGLLLLPPLAQALPGQYRVRLAQVPLGETLLKIGAVPMPTALPAPAGAVAQSRVAIPTMAAVAPTATAAPAIIEAQPPDPSTPAAPRNPTAIEKPAETPTATPLPTNTPTPIPLPRQAYIEGLKIIPQGFNNCGPANLVINLNFYGDLTTQAEAAAILKPNPEDRNVSPWQMVDYVNERTDLRAFVGSGGDLELIKRFIAAGMPIVIEKGYEPTPQDGWLGHYLTMFAYDDDTEEFLSLDTNLGPWDSSGRVDSYETIAYYWQQFNYTFFVVYPPEQEALALEMLGAAMLDRDTMWRRAAERAQAEIEADSDNAFAWFNLGSNLTRLGEMTGEAAYYENGAAAFDQAFILGLPPRTLWYRFRPYIAYMRVGRYQDMLELADVTLSTQGGRNVEETYLYKGHALVFLGDAAGAAAAYRQALRLNKYFYPAQWALDSIGGG
jgi:hypothetical protein